VWDPLVRILHWLLLAGVVAAWWTRHGYGAVHEWIGYAALTVVLLRLAWGFGPSRHARIGGFLRSPAETLHYARNLARPRRYLGHNPLGGWMSVLLWTVVTAVCLSGWLYTTDRFWGVEWVEDLHDGLTNLLIGLVALHLIGVVSSSFKNRENLAAAMLHGRKRVAEGDDVD
jgi:cytochrome b